MKNNPKGIFSHRSYTVEELAVLLGKNSKTLLRWIGKGLKTIPESKKPILIMGSDLKEFLVRRSMKGRVRLGPDQFYCLVCGDAVLPKEDSVESLGNRKVALCAVCGRKIGRIIRPYRKGL